MYKLFPEMFDRPDNGMPFAGILFNVLCFYSMPFLVILLSIDMPNNDLTVSWFDGVYHLACAVMSVVLYRTYLTESFLNVQLNWKGFWKTVTICVGVIFAIALLIFLWGYLAGSYDVVWFATMMLPMPANDLFMVFGALIEANPVVGLLCVGVMAPVTIGCLFYATGFAPMACRNWKLGYVAVALMAAIPRVCNAITFWDPMTELALYLVQLPAHLVACWGYQKTDTVWTPIAVLSITNLIAGLIILML